MDSPQNRPADWQADDPRHAVYVPSLDPTWLDDYLPSTRTTQRPTMQTPTPESMLSLMPDVEIEMRIGMLYAELGRRELTGVTAGVPTADLERALAELEAESARRNG